MLQVMASYLCLWPISK